LNLVGGTLYGTTLVGGGGFLGVGAVFKMNTDGSGYTLLKAFSGSEGSRLYAGVTVSGNLLYGTCSGGGSKYSGVVYSLGTTVLPPTAPIITSQPQSQTNEVGAVVAFQVGATGTAPLSYQWLKDASNLSNGAKISGANSNVLTLTNLQTSDTGNYSVIVSNSSGAIT